MGTSPVSGFFIRFYCSVFIGFYVCFDFFLIKRLGLPVLEMKGDSMEIYCVHKLVRDGGNLPTPEFMRLDKAWLPTRTFHPPAWMINYTIIFRDHLL